MRRSFIFLAVGLMACAAWGQPQQQRFPDVALGTNTSGSATLNFSGHINAVYVSVSDGSSTGTVTVSYAPLVGGTAVNVATNAVTDEKVFRPRVDGTSVAGVDLTGDPPSMYSLVGETLTFAVASSPTGLTWSCLVVVEDSK